MNNTTDTVSIRYFSGYIRNWRKLCAELGIEQSLSREEREAAILIAAYKKWGVELTSHIYGMFAIALWDGEKQKLYVIRDQVGQKQMFYSVINGEFVCSGDINEIRFDDEIDYSDSEIEDVNIERLEECIKKLSEADRELLYLRYELELSHIDIAKSFGITEAASRQRLRHAKAKLKAELLKE